MDEELIEGDDSLAFALPDDTEGDEDELDAATDTEDVEGEEYI